MVKAHSFNILETIFFHLGIQKEQVGRRRIKEKVNGDYLKNNILGKAEIIFKSRDPHIRKIDTSLFLSQKF